MTARSFRFAAAMPHADPGRRPILIRIDLETGHGVGKPLSKRVLEQADVYAFVLHAIHLDTTI
jgi:prolyl oligopeptidase